MRFDYALRFAPLTNREPSVSCQRYLWGKPELCLTIGVLYVDVNSCLCPGEEEQAELSVAYNCGGHSRSLLEEVATAG